MEFFNGCPYLYDYSFPLLIFTFNEKNTCVHGGFLFFFVILAGLAQMNLAAAVMIKFIRFYFEYLSL